MARKASTLETIGQALEIIDEYQRQGYCLTLRQLYYQFVARELVENNQKRYKRLGSIIDGAKWDKIIPWDAIEDRTRFLREPVSWKSPEEAIEAVADEFRFDLWAETQNYHPEVWIEKDALIGVIEGICDRRRVPYIALRGYSSGPALWQASERFTGLLRRGIKPVVFYLVDHDPSGRGMPDDVSKRLGLLCERKIDVRCIALTREQVEEHRLPPTLVKDSDSRSDEYKEEH
jgi:hypothetical protein